MSLILEDPNLYMVPSIGLSSVVCAKVELKKFKDQDSL